MFFVTDLVQQQQASRRGIFIWDLWDVVPEWRLNRNDAELSVADHIADVGSLCFMVGWWKRTSESPVVATVVSSGIAERCHCLDFGLSDQEVFSLPACLESLPLPISKTISPIRNPLASTFYEYAIKITPRPDVT